MTPLIVSHGNVGINVTSPTASLDIAGTVKFRNGAGDGKILMSDASGNASWQTPAANNIVNNNGGLPP